MIKNISIIVLCIGILQACTPPDSMITQAKLIDSPTIILPPRPQPIDVLDVNFDVLSKEEVISLVSSEDFKNLIQLSPTDYENLVLNLQDTQRYVHSLELIIDYYETTITRLKADE